MAIYLTFFCTAFIALALIHISALQFFLYWKYLWLDIPVHILGGITCAFGFALYRYNRKPFTTRQNEFFAYVAFALVIGIAWELFEFFAKFSVIDEDFFMDTVIDFCMDIVGVLIGYGIVHTIKKLE